MYGVIYGIRHYFSVLLQFSAGKWFELARYIGDDFEGASECVEQTFFPNAPTNALTINFSVKKNG